MKAIHTRSRRRTVLAGMILAAAGLTGGCGGEDSQWEPDIVVVVIDALRTRELGIFGSNKDLSPNLDRLAREGFCFQRAVAPSSWTKPSVASLFTGRYPSGHGAVGTVGFLNHRLALDEEQVTLAERLKDAGYRTAAFVTNPVIDRPFHFDQGFDVFVQPAGDARGLLPSALRWIEAARGEGKFFCYIHLIDPHMPYFPPEEYRNRYARGDPGERSLMIREGNPFEIETWVQQYQRWEPAVPEEKFRFDFERFIRDLTGRDLDDPLKAKLERFSHEVLLDFEGPDDPELRQRADYLVSLYEGEVAYTDDALGAFIAGLRKSRVLEHTVLVVTADHGEEFLEHGCWGHGLNLHAEALDVPVIVLAPPGLGGFQGECRRPVSLVDLHPTVLNLAGLDVPPGLDGESLLPLMRRGEEYPPLRNPLISELAHAEGCSAAAVTEDFKLIGTTRYDDPETVSWTLYDLKGDPLETRPLDPATYGWDAIRPLRQAAERSLAAQLETYQGGGEPVPVPAKTLDDLRALGY